MNLIIHSRYAHNHRWFCLEVIWYLYQHVHMDRIKSIPKYVYVVYI